MKRTITSISLALSFLSLLVLGIVFYSSRGDIPTAQAKNASNTCTLSGLKGDYGYTLTGFFSPSPGFNVPLAAVGVTTIGEDGSVSSTDTLVVNGLVTENRTFEGNVALNADNPCTGTVTFTNGVKDNLVVVSDGTEIQFIQTAPMLPSTTLQAVVIGTMKKQ